MDDVGPFIGGMDDVVFIPTNGSFWQMSVFPDFPISHLIFRFHIFGFFLFSSQKRPKLDPSPKLETVIATMKRRKGRNTWVCELNKIK